MKISIDLKRLPIEVEYVYVEPEPCIRYEEDYSGYPGADERVFIGDVFHAGQCINNFINELEWWDEIRNLVLEEINKS